MDINLKSEDKFFIKDDNEDLILVDKIEAFPDVTTNRIMFLIGQKFNVNYDDNEIDKNKRVAIQISFEIDAISEIE